MRVYADTSVYGGMFDDEFVRASETFFSLVRLGRFQLVTSALVLDEVAAAPEPVRLLLEDMLPMSDVVSVTEEALRLQKAYLDNGIVAPNAASEGAPL